MVTERQHSIQLKKVQDYYNRAQKYYERIWYRGNRGLGLHYGFWTSGVKNRIEAITRENEVLANLADIRKGELVLDAGCGVAGSGIWLARERGAKVVALNIVESQLRTGQSLAARNLATDSLRFTEADYHRLPFHDGTFDVFWALESIEHSDNVETFIREAFRTLKPGGRAIIAGTFKGKTEATEIQREQMGVGMRAAGAFNDFRRAGEVGAIMAESGFATIQKVNVTGLILKSARQMHDMCLLGLPGARLGQRMGVVSQIMVDNTAWGTYQERLFKAEVISYHLLIAEKL